MRRRGLAPFAGILLLGLMPGAALAGGGGDQGSAGHSGGYCGPKTFAQTVTTGVAGKLDAVDLYLYDAVGNDLQVTIAPLYRGGGLPTGPALAVSSSVTVQKENWYHFTFLAPYSFLVGGKFAIVFSMTGKGSCASGAGADPYPGGTAMQLGSTWTVLLSGWDFAFATWVTPGTAPTAVPVPTPTAAPIPTPAPVATPAPNRRIPPCPPKNANAAAPNAAPINATLPPSLDESELLNWYHEGADADLAPGVEFTALERMVLAGTCEVAA